MRKVPSAVGAMLILWCGAVAAQQPAADPPQNPEIVDYGRDALARMTVPVTINGRGPYRFVVDTASERTVISRELAGALGLSPSTDVVLTSLTDVQSAPTAIITQLDLGRRSVSAMQAPMLAQRHLGADGLLGIDSLRGMRVDLNFQTGEMYLSRLRLQEGRPNDGSRTVRGGDGEVVVRGSTRLGRLILTDASVDGERVDVVVDTGSAVTIGNAALRARLSRRDRQPPSSQIEVTSVTGGTLRMDYARTRSLRIGGASLMSMPIAFAEPRLFAELGLNDRPALLLGMDALQLFRYVSIDFSSRRLRLVPGPGSALERPVRMAALR